MPGSVVSAAVVKRALFLVPSAPGAAGVDSSSRFGGSGGFVVVCLAAVGCVWSGCVLAAGAAQWPDPQL